MEEFRQLGELVESRWRAANYSEEVFPDLCERALIESSLPAQVDPWDVIRWVHTAATLPEQRDVDGSFGQPPLTLFAGSRFHIDLYFWLDGTTSIHQHSFTGAFQVLLGSSIHSHYKFREDKIINEHFSVGELELQEVQLLEQYAVKQIKPGRQYIHSLFHLDRPSATLTIRTQGTPSSAVQYHYHKPYFASNPFYRNVLMTKKLQTITLLVGMKHPDADQMINDLISSSDFQTSFFILLQVAPLRKSGLDDLFGLSQGKDRFEGFMKRARSTHGEMVDLISSVIDEQDRQQNIYNRRSSVTGDEHRFFLALLLNVSQREKILALVKQRFPEGDPVEKVLDWIEELSQIRVLGSKESNALGIEGFGDEHILVLESLLRGKSVEQIKAEEASRTSGVPLPEDKLEKFAGDLKESMLFKTLLN